MKNTMDWMYDKHVGGKVFGLMSTLGGVTNANTLNHMRSLCVGFTVGPCPNNWRWVIKEAFNDEGHLNDPALRTVLRPWLNPCSTLPKVACLTWLNQRARVRPFRTSTAQSIDS